MYKINDENGFRAKFYLNSSLDLCIIFRYRPETKF